MRAIGVRGKVDSRGRCGAHRNASSGSPRPAAGRRATRLRTPGSSVRSRSGAWSSRAAPGCRRWCRGARPTTASSPTRSSTGTSASREGSPGAIVVEATGIRDIPSGPLLRIGHDRFLPGLRELVETVRRASDGRTRLLIQVIDFLAVRRRPEPEKFFARFLAITALAPRASRRRRDRPEVQIRTVLAGLPDDELARVLDDARARGARASAIASA